MYISYIRDRQDLGFMCLKDIEAGNQMTLIVRTGVISITVTILVNSRSFLGDLEVMNQLSSEKPSHERVVSSISNQKLNTLDYYRNRGFTIPTGNVKDGMNIDLRGGSDNLPENPDHKKVDETLKESVGFEKLQKSMVSKSVEDSGSWSDRSFNKIVIGVLDKLEPIIGNQKFLRLLAETQKPVKSELPISMEARSKARMYPKPQKPSAKRSSSIFAEALVPINPHRWPPFLAGSAMASDMPDVKDKLQNPLDNLRVAKEYLETAQSDLQWRARLWQVAEDTMTINIASEQGDVVGSFVAGAASNKIADGYMDEMIDTEVTKNQQEKLNFEMFKQTAREQGKDIFKVRGTGLRREFVPEFMQEDMCNRPERNARPDSWEETRYRDDDESFFN